MSSLEKHVGETRLAQARMVDLEREDSQEKENRKNPAFVQIQREAMPAIGRLAEKHPSAFQIIWHLADKCSRQNAVCITQQALAKRLNLNIQTIKIAIRYLAENNWIEIIKIGKTNAYVLNSRVVWKTDITGRWAVFHATIIADEADQAELTKRKQNETLKQMPILGYRETAILTGPENEQKDLDL